jgi:hypothetical protein
MESATARARSHQPGVKHQSRRIPARGEWAGRFARRRTCTASSRAWRTSLWCLKVGSDPTGTGSRLVTVVPGTERIRARGIWPGSRRTGAKVDPDERRQGSLHLHAGHRERRIDFLQPLFSDAQIGKQAAIVDERFNSGRAARQPMSRRS